MQDRYAGDVGDYAKLALLRALIPGRRLGVVWWRYPDESHTGDGRHIGYLNNPSQWRNLDPVLFDCLGGIVRAGERTVSALQVEGLLGDAVFCDEVIPTGLSSGRLTIERTAWFERVRSRVSSCDLVFLDPDNGLEPLSYSLGAVSGGKCVSVSQIKALMAPGRTLVVYHHQTRRKGGHLAELDYWCERLRLGLSTDVDVIRARPYSPRAFFLLNASDDVRRQAELLAARWGNHMSWHPGPAEPVTPGDLQTSPEEGRSLLHRVKAWLRAR